MMASQRAPKQWSLTRNETITTYESWKQNLIYVLSLDTNFAPFLITGAVWDKKTRNSPLRGFTNDVDMTARGARTAAQKVAHLELMLGQIANFCPIISRNTIVKNSTSLDQIWQSIRAHFGFQSTGAHLLDLASFQLKPDERPEDLYQRLMAFVEDNLLLTTSGLTHHGDRPDEDEELSPTLENIIVLIWLQLIHKDLPSLVKQKYGTELRSRTLASIKPEISQALDTLLDTLHSNEEAKVMRSAGFNNRSVSFQRNRPKQQPSCPICKAAGKSSSHFLSRCPNLPEADRRFLSRARLIAAMEEEDSDETQGPLDDISQSDVPDVSPLSVSRSAASRRVQINQSPHVLMHYHHHPVKLTLDSGAETNMIRAATAKAINAPITASSQIALQADGRSPLQILGETKVVLTRNNQSFQFDALVVSNLDVDVLAGVPFLCTNDISMRPARFEITFRDGSTYHYNDDPPRNRPSSVKRASVHLLRSPKTTVWPGEFLEMQIPPDICHADVAIEPRTDNLQLNCDWPPPSIVTPVAGRIRIPNLTATPRVLKKDQHFAQVVPLMVPSEAADHRQSDHLGISLPTTPCLEQISVDPDEQLPVDIRNRFHSLHKEFSSVFTPRFKGYNGACGPVQAVVNIGPVQPPQRKGRVPQYSRDKLIQLQDEFDHLESLGVFAKPEDIGVVAEYVNPSFLVKKPSGGFRLVTSFGEVAQYAKPQPALMPDVNTTLQTIGQWKYVITTDLSKSFYQIPMAKESLKYCGVCTPFKGIRVYTRSAMGMPGSETALEELMSRVLGHLVQEGVVAKIADDLYVGGQTPTELLNNWKRVLSALSSCDIVLSPPKTIISPKSTSILGWIWSQGNLRASPHRISTLSTCARPTTVKGLRSFLGAYKFLARVIPNCSAFLAPLEQLAAGRQSSEPIKWTDTHDVAFHQAQTHLLNHKTITLPRADDRLWLVTDGAVRNHGIAATLYVNRGKEIRVAGYFSAKLKERQTSWLPCEVEALCIASSIRHFSPYIIQSVYPASILTDSEPCVKAYARLMRGSFSHSSRVTTFLSVASRFAVTIQHLAGTANVPSDFGSRNAPPCSDSRCQICSFVHEYEESVVLRVEVSDIISGATRMPFTTRSAWQTTQTECSDLRRVHAHLSQGTRPSKKLTNIKDVKRYLQVSTIAKDGLLVVIRTEPFAPAQERIVVPRHVLQGLLTALHLRLDHPTQYQLKQVFNRYFYALDFDAAVTLLYSHCHTCVSLRKLPHQSTPASTTDPPSAIGLSFATDVIRRNRQFILLVRETVTSFTDAVLVDGEDHVSLRNGLLQMCVQLRPESGPTAVVRADPAPGFSKLVGDKLLSQHGLSIDIGRVKNKNKNPIAEKAVQELEDEFLRQDPDQPFLTSASLAVAVARLNSRIRHQGVSARELWTQRDQFTNKQLPIDDRQVIQNQYQRRLESNLRNNVESTRGGIVDDRPIRDGDLVYIVNERSKLSRRPRYIVTRSDGQWFFVRKFTGNQLRPTTYKVHRSELQTVPSIPTTLPSHHRDAEDDSSDVEDSPYSRHHQYDASEHEQTAVPVVEYLNHLQAGSVDTDTSDVVSIPNPPQPPAVLTEPPTEAASSRPQRTTRLPQRFKDFDMSSG